MVEMCRPCRLHRHGSCEAGLACGCQECRDADPTPPDPDVIYERADGSRFRIVVVFGAPERKPLPDGVLARYDGTTGLKEIERGLDALRHIGQVTAEDRLREWLDAAGGRSVKVDCAGRAKDARSLWGVTINEGGTYRGFGATLADAIEAALALVGAHRG